MRGLVLSTIIAVGFASSHVASAQSVKSTVVASNGVEVEMYADEFADRYEYTAPTIDLADGFALVATVKKAGIAPAAHIIGSMIYSGEWRRYQTALFRGGDPAEFTAGNKDVGRCHSSRYSRSSCTLTENFSIEISPEEIAKYSQNGVLAIQVRAADTSTAMVEIPVAYIEAVNEVASR